MSNITIFCYKMSNNLLTFSIGLGSYQKLPFAAEFSDDLG